MSKSDLPNPFDVAQRQVLERIASGAPLSELLDRIVRMVESQSTGMQCSILLVDSDGKRLLHGAAPSLPADYSRAIDGYAIGPSAGSCGTAAHRRERVIVADIASDRLWDDYRRLALPFGLRACWSSPIFSSEQELLGTFAMYYPEVRRPTDEEIEWVNVATHLAAIAICRDRDEQKRLHLVGLLQERLKELTLLRRLSRMLQTERPLDQAFFLEFAACIPSGWRHPEICGARVAWGEIDAKTPLWEQTKWVQSSEFRAAGSSGVVQVCYAAERAISHEGPFLEEERNALDSIAEMLGVHIQTRLDAAAMREANQKIQFYVSRIPMAYLVWDQDLKVSEWNPAAEKIFGWTALEAIGRPLPDLIVPPEALGHVRRVFADLFDGGEWSAHSINENVRKDGSRLICEWFNAPLRDPEGRVIGCLSMGSDISERKKAEDERAALESQLRQVQRLQSLGTLAGGIAHDFNNILTAINGNASLILLDLEANSPLHRPLSHILKAGDRATELVKRILTFSRQQEPLRKTIRLSNIIDEAVAFLRSTTPSRIQIKADCETSLPKIVADATQIHQILMNLGTNAVHALGEANGTIVIKAERYFYDPNAGPNSELKDGEYVRLTVSDNGCGMPPEIVDRIFEPFFTTKAPGQGTGLGLSMVHGIVKNHGGAITVQSQPSQGTAFHIFFPAAAPAETEFLRRVDKLLPGQGEHILYVDDEEPLVYLVTHHLERLGYKVTGMCESLQALEFFRNNASRVDAVVTDFSMPSLSGGQLASEIRKIRTDTAIIITSGYIRAEDVQAVEHLKILDFILKPNTVEDLTQILDRLFAERRTKPLSG